MPSHAGQRLLQFGESALWRADQILNRRFRGTHLGQNLFGGNAAVHQPDALSLAILPLDAIQKILERRLVGGVARQHLVGQRQTFGRNDQRDHHLHAIGPVIARVAVAPLVALRERWIGLEIGARQIVEKDIELGVEQIPPAARQMIEHRLLVRQEKIVTGVKLVAFGKTKILTQKIGERAPAVPFAMQPPFAARRKQSIGHQHEQHQVKARALAVDGKPRFPEAVELQLLPQALRQPARAPLARPFQAKLGKLHADNRAIRQKSFATVLGKQRQRLRMLAALLEDFNRFAPRPFLAVVDLAQIKHVALHHAPATADALVLHHAEITVDLAVLLANQGAQKHDGRELSTDRGTRKHAWSALQPFAQSRP